MNRIRTVALLLTTTVLATGVLAQSATAATTPLSKLKADMAHVKKAENSYSKAHHSKAKKLTLKPGHYTHVGKYKVTARAKEHVAVVKGHEGKKLGYCATINYTSYNGAGHFAYYDSILKVTRYNATDYKVGGACYSTAQQQEIIRGNMSDETGYTYEEEEEYSIDAGTDYGVTFTADSVHITTLPNGDEFRAAYAGDVIHAYANPTRHGYCIVVTNPLSTYKKHSTYFASTTVETAAPTPINQGVFGDAKTGSCAAPLK